MLAGRFAALCHGVVPRLLLGGQGVVWAPVLCALDKERIVNAILARRGWLLGWLLIVPVFLTHASVTAAAPTAQFWEELAGSASGPGISASVRGVAGDPG